MPTPATQADREQQLTEAVVASFGHAPDPRLREILESLVRHLHGFAREVRLTEREWAAGIAFLTQVGHRTDERRQEYVLLSDVLGLSMQTVILNDTEAGEATESTVLGPFFVEGAPEIQLGGDIAEGAPGEPSWVEGVVTATDGSPVPGVRLDVGRPTATASTTCSAAATRSAHGASCAPTVTAATGSGR